MSIHFTRVVFLVVTAAHSQEPAAVTCARKAQEKLEREKGMAAFVTYLTSNVNSLELIDLSGDNKVYFVRSSLFFNLQSS